MGSGPSEPGGPSHGPPHTPGDPPRPDSWQHGLRRAHTRLRRCAPVAPPLPLPPAVSALAGTARRRPAEEPAASVHRRRHVHPGLSASRVPADGLSAVTPIGSRPSQRLPLHPTRAEEDVARRKTYSAVACPRGRSHTPDGDRQDCHTPRRTPPDGNLPPAGPATRLPYSPLAIRMHPSHRHGPAPPSASFPPTRRHPALHA